MLVNETFVNQTKSENVYIANDTKECIPTDEYWLEYSHNPFDSALSMAQAIQGGNTTSRKLVDMFIERIERLDDKINAVVQRDFIRARQDADQADMQYRNAKESGQLQSLGIFHGVPMTLKEGTLTKGYRTCNGDPWMFFLPKWLQHEHTTRLLNAGAILMGKTNLAKYQCDWECHNPVYGRTANPYDVTKSPGGSSGGSAAALAAGFSAIELGSDIGGSIRIPAVNCGIVGHVPTRGLTPSFLDIDLGWLKFLKPIVNNLLNPIVWLARIGPMARTIEDVTAMLEVLVKDNTEGLRRPQPGGKLQDYRIAIWRTHEISPPGAEVNSAMDKVIEVLQSVGATVVDFEPPTDPMTTYTLYLQYLSPFMSFWKLHMPKEQRENAKEWRARDSYPLDMKSPFWELDNAAVHGIPEDTHEAYKQAEQAWSGYLKQNYDVILSPIFPCPAWENASGPNDILADAQVLSRPIMVDGKARYYGDGLFWSHVSVLFGLPATGFPVGFTTDGQLPVGLQAMGAQNDDFIVLDVVQKLMEALKTNEFQPPPGFE